MKYYKFHFLPIIWIVFTLCLGCKKSGGPPVYQLSLSRNALEYIQLPLGKYLIYKDSATSLTDSVIITTSKLTTNYQPQIGMSNYSLGSFAFYYESYDLVLTKFDANFQSDWFTGITTNAYLQQGIYESANNLPVIMEELNGLQVFYCSDQYQSGVSMTVEGKTYDSVIEVDNNNGLDINDPGYKRSIYYWSKSFGIIKRTLINGLNMNTYTLVRNN